MKLKSALIAVALLALISIVGGFSVWMFWPRPTLDGVAERIVGGRFIAAEQQLRKYLKAYPNDETARLMLAKVLLDRPEPEPETALGLIETIQPTDPHRAALARAIEGDVHFWAGRYDRAEPAWLEALRLEPTIPEVGWKLLNIYAIQDRNQDSRNLALRLFRNEPDERDRVQLLLQLIRHDSHPIETASIVHSLEPIVRSNPADIRSSTSLGLALVRLGRTGEGLAILRRNAWFHGADPETRLAYIDGLIATGDLDELSRTLDGIPASLTDSPRFQAAKGWLASQKRELDEAALAYRKALDYRPVDAGLAYYSLAYRYKGVLRQANRLAEVAELEPKLDAIAKFPVVVRDYFDRINELPDLGIKSNPQLFEQLATLLSQVGRQEEADAWMVLAKLHGHGKGSP